jgi:hypothetical protein
MDIPITGKNIDNIENNIDWCLTETLAGCHHIQNQYVQGRFLLQFCYFKSPNQTDLDESNTSLVPHKPTVNFCLHMDEK